MVPDADVAGGIEEPTQRQIAPNVLVRPSLLNVVDGAGSESEVPQGTSLNLEQPGMALSPGTMLMSACTQVTTMSLAALRADSVCWATVWGSVAAFTIPILRSYRDLALGPAGRVSGM